MKPLQGIRILELARVLAGPWAGQMLADLGAEVIKVERPGEGDDTRAWGPPFFDEIDGRRASAYYHATNRGKKSVEIDLTSKDGQELVRAIAAQSDVVIENFKVGGLKRYGLDYDSLRAVNERLIYCSVTGFGQDGPYAPRPGYDPMIQAIGGMMALNGAPESEPVKAGIPVSDLFTGVYAAAAILAALYRRQAAGVGSYIDMALLDVQIGVLGNHAMSFFATGKSPARLGNAHPSLCPYQVFAAADGDLVILAGNDGQFRRLCDVVGLPELALKPEYANNALRVAHRSELIAALSERVASLEAGSLVAALDAAGIPATRINDVREAFADAQVRHRAMAVNLPAPASVDGHMPSVRTPIVIDGVAACADWASPALGEHTDEVIRAFAPQLRTGNKVRA